MIKKFKYLIIMLLLSIIPFCTYAYSNYVIASGENVGIKLKTKGIIIVGKYDKFNSTIKTGDIITTLNDDEIIDLKEFTEKISKIENGYVNIGYIRDNKEKETKLKVIKGKTGLYLKDTIIGIGTLTFIDPKTKIYGALGHEIIESISGMIIDINDGEIYDSKVTDIKRSTTGVPGEKNAYINDETSLGDIDINTTKGIYGDYIGNTDTNNLYKVGTYNNIKIGKAYILTELNNNVVDKYEIEILNIINNNDTKNILFKVTDKRLIDVGGIVQGMSGSPITQDEYIIGAVTHVLVDNPTKGYGILITNMLEEADKKDE